MLKVIHGYVDENYFARNTILFAMNYALTLL